MTDDVISRRTVLTGAAALAAVGFVSETAEASPSGKGKDANQARITVVGTTDLHGNVFNWDYFKNAEFTNATGDDIGLAKAATLVKAVRADRRGEPILTLDAGDTIQGTPLAYYYAKVDPITDGATHPMAAAMNQVGYDAAALGNHEFNYGIETLRTFESQLNFPLLGANALDATSGKAAFPAAVIKTFKLGRGRAVTVGILGLTNPGIALWDKANVEGRMTFPGLVEQASIQVPQLKAAGCDLIVVAAHSGATTSSSYGDTLPYPENASTLLAEQVPDIDAILVGHAHVEIPQKYVTNASTGKQVLLVEPLYWGMRVAVIDFNLRFARGRWTLSSATSQVLNSNTVDADPAVLASVQAQHNIVIDYVNSVIGTSAAQLLAARAVVEDVPIIDFVNFVQADAVKAGLSGDDAALPVLSIAAPFNRGASFPSGEVTVRDVAGLYIYDNTLLGVKITGAQLKDYLEYSARYFKPVTSSGPVTMAEVTNAVTPTAPNGTPDYNFDTVAGLDAPLTYKIDLAQPVDSRITGLAYDGVPVGDDQEFALAINNYRQSGGGGFPHVASAPVIYNRQNEIRQLLIDWVSEHGVIDPAQFASVDWTLVANGTPLEITN